MKRLLLTLCVAVGFGWAILPAEHQVAWAQNTTCSDRPPTDSSNACANTRFVHANAIPALPNGEIFIGNISNVPTARTMSGDCTITNTGVITCVGGGGSAVVGTILPWAGATVPPTYLLTYGQAVSRTTYSHLFSAIVSSDSITCSSGSPTVTVSAATAQRVPIGAPIEASACFAPGTLVATKGSTTISMNSNAIASTSTTLRVFPWGNGDGSTTFNVPNLQGRSTVGRDNMQGTAAGVLTSTYYNANPDALNALGGAQSTTLGTSNLPAYTPTGSITGTVTTSINDPGHVHNMSSYVRFVSPFGFPGVTSGGVAASLTNVNQNTDVSTTGITATSSTAGMTFTGNAQGGSSTAFSQVQPSVTLDWIIKAEPDAGLTNDNITVGVTTVTSGSNTNVLYNNNGVVGEYAIATFPDMYAGTAANKLVTPSTIWPPEVTVTYGTTTTFDMSTFRDAVVTLTGDITTMTVSNVVVGKSGSITFIQDSGGGHTTVWDSKFKFAGGTTPTLTTAANAVDILNYQCRTSTFCFAAMMNDVK